MLGLGILSFLFKQGNWWVWTLLAAFISQIIVVGSWEELRYVSILNVAVIIASLLVYKFSSFEKSYQDDVKSALKRTATLPHEKLQESDLAALPILVQKYIKSSGAIGRPKVYNMKVTFSGQMRNRTSDWFDFTSEQYNFFDSPQRNFFMKARVKKIPTWGYHAYKDGKASMNIKAMSTVPLVSIMSNELDISETVTLFNDMCILAPASLIDDRIKWKAIDDRSVLATFTNEGITISATLYFNDKSQLINFVSEDRIEINDNRKYRFSTPLSEYNEVNGYRLPTKGTTTWHYLEGPFAYGVFNLETIEFNCKPKI